MQSDWQNLAKRYITSNVTSNLIALGALIFTVLPFYDLVVRKWTAASIEILPPSQVDFRAKDVQQKMDDKGQKFIHPDDSPVIDNVSKKFSTYVILPLSYINRGDAGEDFLIPLERLHVNLGEDSFVFSAAYTTAIVPRKQSSWIGDTSPRLPTVLEGGRARSDEVVFITNNATLNWEDFIENLRKHPDKKIQIKLNIETLSGEVFHSTPCQLSIKQLLKPLNQIKDDRSRYYRVNAECK